MAPQEGKTTIEIKSELIDYLKENLSIHADIDHRQSGYDYPGSSPYSICSIQIYLGDKVIASTT